MFLNLIVLLSVLLSAEISFADINLVVSKSASEVELNAANELKNDMSKVSLEKVYVSTEKQADSRLTIFMGLQKDQEFSSNFPKYSDLEYETFLLKSLSSDTLLILASEPRSLFYGVYEFSEKRLGIDPLEYWTGKEPVKTKVRVDGFDYRSKKPSYKLRGYFDNDNDMLANWKGRKLIVEFDTWKELIDSLARMRFNFVDIHDTLGRSEFWKWDYYKK